MNSRSANSDSANDSVLSLVGMLPPFYETVRIEAMMGKTYSKDTIINDNIKVGFLKELEIAALFSICLLGNFIKNKLNSFVTIDAEHTEIYQTARQAIRISFGIGYQEHINSTIFYFEDPTKEFYQQYIITKYIKLDELMDMLSTFPKTPKKENIQPIIVRFIETLSSFKYIRFLASIVGKAIKPHVSQKTLPEINLSQQHLSFFDEYLKLHNYNIDVFNREFVLKKKAYISSLTAEFAIEDTIKLFSEMRITLLAVYKIYDTEFNHQFFNDPVLKIEESIYQLLKLVPHKDEHLLVCAYDRQGSNQPQRDILVKYMDHLYLTGIIEHLRAFPADKHKDKSLALYGIMVPLKNLVHLLSYQINMLQEKKSPELFPEKAYQCPPDMKYVAPKPNSIVLNFPTTKVATKGTKTKRSTSSSAPITTSIATTKPSKKSKNNTNPTSTSSSAIPAAIPVAPPIIDPKETFDNAVAVVQAKLAIINTEFKQLQNDYRALYKSELLHVPVPTRKSKKVTVIALGEEILDLLLGLEAEIAKQTYRFPGKNYIFKKFEAFLDKLDNTIEAFQKRIHLLFREINAPLTTKELKKLAAYHDQELQDYLKRNPTPVKTDEPSNDVEVLSMPEILPTPSPNLAPVSTIPEIQEVKPAPPIPSSQIKKVSVEVIFPKKPVVKSNSSDSSINAAIADKTTTYTTTNIEEKQAQTNQRALQLKKFGIVTIFSNRLAKKNNCIKKTLAENTAPSQTISFSLTAENINPKTAPAPEIPSFDSEDSIFMRAEYLQDAHQYLNAINKILTNPIHVNSDVVHYALLFNLFLYTRSLNYLIADLQPYIFHVSAIEINSLRHLARNYGTDTITKNLVREFAEIITSYDLAKTRLAELYSELVNFHTLERTNGMDFKDDGYEIKNYISLMRNILTTAPNPDSVELQALYMLAGLCGELSLTHYNPELKNQNFNLYCRDNARKPIITNIMAIEPREDFIANLHQKIMPENNELFRRWGSLFLGKSIILKQDEKISPPRLKN